MNPRPMVTCAGGLNLDRILRLDDGARLGTSNPGATTTSPGGVARNIADRLARAGVPTALFGAVGRDDDGRRILDHASSLGIDVDSVAVLDHPTGSYTAIIDPSGALVIGVSDMAATTALQHHHLGDLAPLLERSAWLVVDTNLTPTILAELAEMAAAQRCLVAANSVSVAKSGRVRGLPVDLLFCSLDEAEALAGEPLSDADHCRNALRDIGPGSAVVTRGPDGAWYFDVAGSGTIPGQPIDATDTTGAGDALVGETVRSLMEGYDLGSAVARGVGVAGDIVRHLGAAPIAPNDESS